MKGIQTRRKAHKNKDADRLIERVKYHLAPLSRSELIQVAAASHVALNTLYSLRHSETKRPTLDLVCAVLAYFDEPLVVGKQ